MMPRRIDFSVNTIRSWNDGRWKATLHVNKVTFRYLCIELRGRLQRRRFVRDTISVEKRVAITLWRLGTNHEYPISSV